MSLTLKNSKFNLIFSYSMPYAQQHYPFENKEKFEANFPADFIAEGIDQTRGWFYTLMVLSTHLFDKPAWKNIIVNGLVLARFVFVFRPVLSFNLLTCILIQCHQ